MLDILTIKLDLRNRKFFTHYLPEKVAEIGTRVENEAKSNHLQGDGMKIIIPSCNIGIWTRLKVLLGLNLAGHNNTLSEATKLIYVLYQKNDIEKEQN